MSVYGVHGPESFFIAFPPDIITIFSAHALFLDHWTRYDTRETWCRSEKGEMRRDGCLSINPSICLFSCLPILDYLFLTSISKIVSCAGDGCLRHVYVDRGISDLLAEADDMMLRVCICNVSVYQSFISVVTCLYSFLFPLSAPCTPSFPS